MEIGLFVIITINHVNREKKIPLNQPKKSQQSNPITTISIKNKKLRLNTLGKGNPDNFVNMDTVVTSQTKNQPKTNTKLYN